MTCDVVVQKFGEFGDAVADEIVKKLAGQLADPMRFAAENRSDITGVAQVISPMAFKVDRLAAEKTTGHELAHFHHFQGELIIMAGGDFQVPAFGERNQFLRLRRRDRERLFQINMAAGFETLPGQREMSLRGRGDVNDIRLRGFQHLLCVGENARNPEAFGQLPGHEPFAVADRNDFAVGNATDGLHVLVGDFSAPNDGNS